MKLHIIISILFLMVSAIFPQQTGIWKNYTDLRSISDAVITNDGVWAASRGGAFHFNFQDRTYQILNMTNTNNLITGIAKLTSIAVDNEGKVWMGNEDGFIDVYNPQSESFKRIFEISNYSESERKRINDIKISGDSVYVTTAFGLSVINTRDYSFVYSTIKFGSFNTNINTLNTFFHGSIYVGTESGIARLKEGSSVSAPESPESWEVYTTLSGLPSNLVNEVITFKDTLVASTSNGVAKFLNNQWLSFLPELNGKNIIDVLSKVDSLFLISKLEVRNDNNKIIDTIYDFYTYNSGKLTLVSPDCGYKKLFTVNNNSVIYAATDNGIINIGSKEYFYPEGPRSNNFINMDVDGSGNLWVATGKDGLGVGINKFDGTNWKNFNTRSNGLLINDYWRVYAAPDNKVYAGSWGRGFTRIDNDKITNFSADNTGLIGLPGGPEDLKFIVIHGLNTDSKGNLWILNYWSSSNQTLNKLTPDSTWEHFINPLISSSLTARELAIDQNDTKWFTVGDFESPSGTALYYFNEEQSLYSSDINGWGQVNLSTSSISVTALALDRRGELWVGTSEGIYIISDPGSPKNSISQFIRPLSTQSISTIVVDALNQKWVGTRDGVYLVSPDGTQVLQNYNISNSPIMDNSIVSIAIDDNSGIVYIGTDYGLSSLSTLSIAPQNTFSELEIYPNPALLENGVPVKINIDGLIRDTDIKILSISGSLIKTFTTPGGRRAEWDGKDDFGNIVPSGIYLIIAYDKEGNNIATSKVAVIRK